MLLNYFRLNAHIYNKINSFPIERRSLMVLFMELAKSIYMNTLVNFAIALIVVFGNMKCLFNSCPLLKLRIV
jgi:hypothetical protein